MQWSLALSSHILFKLNYGWGLKKSSSSDERALKDVVGYQWLLHFQFWFSSWELILSLSWHDQCHGILYDFWNFKNSSDRPHGIASGDERAGVTFFEFSLRVGLLYYSSVYDSFLDCVGMGVCIMSIVKVWVSVSVSTGKLLYHWQCIICSIMNFK